MRIDDDSAERAVAEARAQDKKLQQQQQKRRADESTAFDKALAGKKQQEGTAARSFAERQQATSRSPVKELLAAHEGEALEPADLEEQQEAEHAAEHQGAALQRGRTAAGRKEIDRKTGRQLESGRGEDHSLHAAAGERVRGGQREQEGRAVLRQHDARSDDRRQEARDERGAQPSTAGRASATPGKVTAREQKGDQQGGQQGSGNPGGQPGAFRLPPSALMAPPPLAVPKEAPQVSRLRALAQEIAEKIVKAARVGVNKLGLPEFQLELKSDILQGLKVKVSGRHGRIRAHFSSRDPKVLKQLRGEIDGLRSALSARGLKVDALEIEEERA